MADQTYTEEERKQLANIIIIDYDTQADEEDAEAPALHQVEVKEATDTLIELQMTYNNPGAVSRDPTTPDKVSISFDKRYFSDPETDLEINEGSALILNIPRQIDPAKAE